MTVDLKVTLETAQKLKAVMKRQNLRKAKAKCPRCEGYIWGTLNGKKDHLHMRCDGPCKMFLME